MPILPMTDHDDSVCPLCGSDNACGARQGLPTCWCWDESFAPGVRQLVPAALGDRCLCSACARGEVPSPCTGVCELDARTRLCRGCGRTVDEIAGWQAMPVTQKLAVLRRLRGVR